MRLHYLLFSALLVCAAGAAYLWYSGVRPFEAVATAGDLSASDIDDANQPPPVRLGRGGRPVKSRKPFNPQSVQVVTEDVREGEVPVYLSGLGTVIAYNTVDTKSQVDGIITKMNFKEGDDVKAGDPLITIDPTPYQALVNQWVAVKQRAEAQLANAKTNLWRDQQLLSHSYVSQKQTDEQAALVDQYSAEIAQAEAQIKFYQTQLDHTVIRSPIDGRTGIRHVDPGNFVRAANNTNIVTVVQLQPISVLVSVPARDLAQAGGAPGLSNLQVLAFAQDGTTLLDRGQLQTINNVVNAATGTIQLKATFPNSQYRLWPGDFVISRVVVEKRNAGLTVPSSAIRHGARGDFLWVIKPDQTAEARHVKVKQTVAETTLLDLGVEPGEHVVTEGQYHLQVGSRVEIVPKGTISGPRVSGVE